MVYVTVRSPATTRLEPSAPLSLRLPTHLLPSSIAVYYSDQLPVHTLVTLASDSKDFSVQAVASKSGKQNLIDLHQSGVCLWFNRGLTLASCCLQFGCSLQVWVSGSSMWDMLMEEMIDTSSGPLETT